ncbi:MAG: oxidoreductase, partial [Pseudomonadota bacterium]
MTEPRTEASLIDALKNLAPLLEENAANAERDRRPVDAVMQAIEGTGAYKYFVPKRFGGYEYSLAGFMDIGLALGEACLSTAWVTTFCMEHNWLLSLFAQEAQEDIFGKQPYIIAPGVLAPNGKATPVDDGYRVTGRWQWGTGVMHADWVMVGAITPQADSDQLTLCMYIVPIDEVEVIDTWYVDGMVGTGSNDIALQDVFIPQHRMVNLADIR